MQVGFFVILGALLFGAYEHGRTLVMTELYEEKLSSLTSAYESLRTRYNTAVEKSAVTELRVENDRIEVVVRGADQVLEQIPTPIKPTHEIHVDFVVRDSRLFMRRIYDDQTAPRDGFVIDPKLQSIDWSDTAFTQGLSVYRGALTPGRWVVRTSGNGALDLVQVDADEPLNLAQAPKVRSFEEIEREIAEDLETVTTVDVLRRLGTKIAQRKNAAPL